MQAFHTNWTRPTLHRNTDTYSIEDFELLTTILSALEWQEHNGSIQMVTDKVGAEYYRKLDLESIWDLGIDDTLEDDIPISLNPATFWAAGKIYALAKQTTPCVMMDTDFIVWRSLERVLGSHALEVIHEEELEPSVYPPAQQFKMKDSYYYHTWDWTKKACNTAFVVFNDEALKNHYVKQAKRFMTEADGEDPLIYMVFAEQRLLAMCAAEMDIMPYPLATLNYLFTDKQEIFTHIWGFKRQMRMDKSARTDFCTQCIERIKQDFPNYYPLLTKIDSFKEYIRN